MGVNNGVRVDGIVLSSRVVLEVEVYSFGVTAVAHIADHFTGLDLTVNAEAAHMRSEVVVAVGGNKVKGSASQCVPPSSNYAIHRRQDRIVPEAYQVDALVLAATRPAF